MDTFFEKKNNFFKKYWWFKWALNFKFGNFLFTNKCIKLTNEWQVVFFLYSTLLSKMIKKIT